MQFYWAETVMFIKKWQLIFLYTGRMDWGEGGGHLAIVVITGGGAFANKNCPQDRTKDSSTLQKGILYCARPAVRARRLLTD